MAFLETPRFPDRIAAGALGGPAFSTQVVVAASGRQFTDAQWEYPLHSWDVSHGLNNPTDFAALRAFFLAVRGRRDGWRFKDWTDYSATVAEGFVIGLTSTTFQMVKRYTSGSTTLDRLISKPVTGTVAAFVSAVPATFTVDTTTGILTIAAAPSPSNVTWSGEFDVPMAFETDKLTSRVVGRNGAGLIYEWDGIPVAERPI